VRIRGARTGLIGLPSKGKWVSKSDRVAYPVLAPGYGPDPILGEILSSNGPAAPCGGRGHLRRRCSRTPCRCRQTRIPAAPSPKMSPCWGCPRSTATDLNILGRPDGVRTSTGALPPIEIKSHRDVSKTDELELHSTGLASIAESIFRARKSATSGRPWPAEARGRFVKAGSPG